MSSMEVLAGSQKQPSRVPIMDRSRASRRPESRKTVVRGLATFLVSDSPIAHGARACCPPRRRGPEGPEGMNEPSDPRLRREVSNVRESPKDRRQVRRSTRGRKGDHEQEHFARTGSGYVGSDRRLGGRSYSWGRFASALGLLRPGDKRFLE